MIIKVIDSATGREQNFYDASYPNAMNLAKDCKRQMKALTGREYEIVTDNKEES